VQILRAMNLHEAADRLATPADELIAAHRRRLESARGEMHRFGVAGVPAFVVGTADNRRLVSANALFGSMEVLVEGLKAA
jgi:putative protein-disulfide isomerase